MTTRWEYRIISIARPAPIDHTKMGRLVAAGKDGWEAVGLSESGGYWSVLLKRPLPRTRSRSARRNRRS